MLMFQVASNTTTMLIQQMTLMLLQLLTNSANKSATNANANYCDY